MMEGKGTLKVYDTPDLMSEAAAKFIIALGNDAIARRRRFTISLSGGSTPARLFALLAKPEWSKQMDWLKVFVFWGDERCVPLDDKRNNAHMAKELLLDKIDIPASNVYRIPVNLSPAEAATSYEQTLKIFFGSDAMPTFDLILLGLGENGHTASLFPGTAVLHEQKAWVKEVYVEEQKEFRITMTAPLINQASNIIFLVSGAEKASVLDAVINGPSQPEIYPSQLIKPVSGNLYWYLDKAAAGKYQAMRLLVS